MCVLVSVRESIEFTHKRMLQVDLQHSRATVCNGMQHPIGGATVPFHCCTGLAQANVGGSQCSLRAPRPPIGRYNRNDYPSGSGECDPTKVTATVVAALKP
jgi:hypothetical protein